MYRRKGKSTSGPGPNSIPSSLGSDLGADIAAPNNTSLIVNRSKMSVDSPDELPKSVVASLYEADDEATESVNINRPSTSLMHSMTQKKQSTPKQDRTVLMDSTNLSVKSEVFSDEPRLSDKTGIFSDELRVSDKTGILPLMRTTSQRSRCFFLETLFDCGADEIVGEGSYKLSQDQALLSRKLNTKIKNDGISSKFLDAFKLYIGNNEKLKKLLMFTQTSNECEAARGPLQEPLLRILLLVDCLQTDILNILLTKLSDITIAQGDNRDQALLVSGILRQVRCLSRVENTKFASKLFNLMPDASLQIQQEIVFLLPELVIEDELADVTSQLTDMLQLGTELTPMIIDSLGNLSLSADLKAQVRENLLSRLQTYPPEFLPSLVHFIISQSASQDMNYVVKALRANLPFSVSRMSVGSLRKMFEDLRNSFMSSKAFTDTWIRIVANLTVSSDFTCLDLVALILIYGHVLHRKPSTLTLLRNKIRTGVLTVELFSETFQNLKSVILDSYKEVLDLSSAFLKSFEHAFADVAKTMLIDLFGIGDAFLRLDIVRGLVVHLTTGTSCAVQNVLSLLIQLRTTNLEKLEPHASLFMSALRIIPDVELFLVRQLVDLVASLVTLPGQQDSGLLEELHIFTRKQMVAWQPETQRRGVISSVIIVKHSALRAAQSDATDLSESDFLLKMAAGTQSVSTARRGFFFDELATVLRESSNNVPFLMSWANRIYNQAMNDVFVSDIDLECDHFPMSLQYCIENAGNLVFPIVAFVVTPKPDAYLNAGTIPAALRLLWCAEKNMNRMSPMLCAAVVLPDPSVFENFLSYSTEQQKIIMNCLFLCANFLIECINALSTQKICEKLVIRLKQLIEIRKTILQYVGQVPEYVPPSCQFHVPVIKPVVKKPANEGKKPGKGRKRKLDGQDANLNQTHLDASALPCTSTAAPTEAVAQVAAPSEDLSGVNFSGAFRELHLHAFKLLRMELKLNPTKVFKKKKMSDLIVMDVSWSYRPQDKPELGPSDTLFLLQDYLAKSDQVLRDRMWFGNKKPTGLVAESISPLAFVNGSVKLLPHLCLKLDVVSTYCKDLLDANDGIWDAPGCFPSGALDIKSSFSALLKIFADLLAWRGFQNPANATILKDVLRIVSRNSTSLSSTQSTASLALEAARFLSNLGGVVPQLSAGVYLTRAVQSCIQYTGSKDFSLVGELCCELLKRPWFTLTGTPDRGVAYNQQVDSIVRMHLACAENRLANIRRVTEICDEEVPGLLSKESTLPTFATLNKANFPLLYRALCEALVTATAEELSKNSGNDENCIEVWATVTSTLVLLAEISKVHSSRTNLAALLKRSQAIIQLFLNKGLPVMESALRIKSNDVLTVLKSLQVVTRFLHSVCCHSKLTSDAVVAAHVPKIRALCERLNLEVKGMLVLNKIPLDFITIAVLKNRDIRGNDISSQTTVATSDDDSELPEEDEPMDDEDIQFEDAS